MTKLTNTLLSTLALTGTAIALNTAITSAQTTTTNQTSSIDKTAELTSSIEIDHDAELDRSSIQVGDRVKFTDASEYPSDWDQKQQEGNVISIDKMVEGTYAEVVFSTMALQLPPLRT